MIVSKNVAEEVWSTPPPQAPINYLSPRIEGVELSQLHLVPRLGISGAVPLLLLYAFMAFEETTSPLHLMAESVSVSFTL